MKNVVLYMAFLLFLAACEKEQLQPIVNHNQIDLSNPKVGQISCYVEYNAACALGNSSYSFSQDTLIVKLIEQDGVLHFMEYLSYHSPSHLDGSFGNPIYHPVIFENDYMLIPERQRSELFYFYGNDTVHIDPVHDLDLNQNGCYLYHPTGEQFVGEEIGFSDEVEFGMINKQEKTVVSCVPTILNLDAYIVYDRSSIHVSHTIHTTTEEKKINGWVLLD
ncbi:MAG: hypothetical protein AAF487_10635 [Bacteroidota bacterium]